MDCLTNKSINMISRINYLTAYALVLLSAIVFSSCDETEDPGPVQEAEKEFAVTEFDRLEMGDAFNINVEQGNFFEVTVRGDRRNVDDLSVTKEGTTLVVRYDDNRNRRHDTYITITMPAITAVNFSGASDSRISGFYDLASFSMYLSGASVSQLDVNVAQLDVVLSGASYLNIRGEGEGLDAKLSGASTLKAFHFPVTVADINASGASDAQVSASNTLHATASGASDIRYRGNPSVTADVSGGSAVNQD
jgi:hypothetical protein